MAELIHARLEDRAPTAEALLVPGIVDGARGVKFIAAAVESSSRGGEWVSTLLDR
jgi:hypothetical protein